MFNVPFDLAIKELRGNNLLYAHDINVLENLRRSFKEELRKAKDKHAHWKAKLRNILGAQQVAVASSRLDTTVVTAHVKELQNKLADSTARIKGLTVQAVDLQGTINDMERGWANRSAQIDAMEACWRWLSTEVIDGDWLGGVYNSKGPQSIDF